MKRRILRKVFAHYYRSGRVGLLFVMLSSRAGKPLRLDITHEAHPTLEQSDASEFHRVIVSALSETADVFNLEFSVVVPQIRVSEAAQMFAFAPGREPILLPQPPGIFITAPLEAINTRKPHRWHINSRTLHSCGSASASARQSDQRAR
jgi:hypothetical protein